MLSGFRLKSPYTRVLDGGVFPEHCSYLYGVLKVWGVDDKEGCGLIGGNVEEGCGAIGQGLRWRGLEPGFFVPGCEDSFVPVRLVEIQEKEFLRR